MSKGKPFEEVVNTDDKVGPVLKNHPMEVFTQFAELQTGEEYGGLFAELLSELATHIVIQADSQSDVEEFIDNAGISTPFFVNIADVGSEETLHRVTPGSENAFRKVGAVTQDDLDSINEDVSEQLDDFEEQVDDAVSSVDLIMQDIQYEELQNAEMAEHWWDLLNIDDFINRSSDDEIVDGGYFRDNIMHDSEMAEAVASNDVGMEVVFAADQLGA